MNPHEVFTTSGRLAGSGLLPAKSVGAGIQVPRPVMPAAHASGARIFAMFHSTLWTVGSTAPRIGVGIEAGGISAILSTAGSAAIASSTEAPEVTPIALTLKNDLKRLMRPACW